MDHKTCNRCQNTLPMDMFYPQQQRGKNGQIWKYRDSYCKSCRLEFSYNQRKSRKREAVAYLGGSCEDCGLTTDKVEVYDFHHTDPSQKDFSISKSGKSLDKLKPELDKCVLLCANCHRLRHG